MKKFFKFIIFKNIYFFFDFFLILMISASFYKKLLKLNFLNLDNLDITLRFFNKNEFFFLLNHKFFFKYLSGYRLLLVFSNSFNNFKFFVLKNFIEQSTFDFKFLILKILGYFISVNDLLFFFKYFLNFISIYNFLLNYLKFIFFKYFIVFGNNKSIKY